MRLPNTTLASSSFDDISSVQQSTYKVLHDMAIHARRLVDTDADALGDAAEDTLGNPLPLPVDTHGDILAKVHTSELTWLIPAVIGVIVVFILLALLAYLGIRRLELKVIQCYHKACPCCRRRGERVPLNQDEIHYYNASDYDEEF